MSDHTENEYTVIYAQSVTDFMMREITSKRVYERIDAYRGILKMFPKIGAEYQPYYEAATPPFPCRFIAVPSTPFTLYYAVDEGKRRVDVFAIVSQRVNPKSRF